MALWKSLQPLFLLGHLEHSTHLEHSQDRLTHCCQCSYTSDYTHSGRCPNPSHSLNTIGDTNNIVSVPFLGWALGTLPVHFDMFLHFQDNGGRGIDIFYCLNTIWWCICQWGGISSPPSCLNTRTLTSTILHIDTIILTLLNAPMAIVVEVPIHSIACTPFYGANSILAASLTHHPMEVPVLLSAQYYMLLHF